MRDGKVWVCGLKRVGPGDEFWVEGPGGVAERHVCVEVHPGAGGVPSVVADGAGRWFDRDCWASKGAAQAWINHQAAKRAREDVP